MVFVVVYMASFWQTIPKRDERKAWLLREKKRKTKQIKVKQSKKKKNKKNTHTQC